MFATTGWPNCLCECYLCSSPRRMCKFGIEKFCENRKLQQQRQQRQRQRQRKRHWKLNFAVLNLILLILFQATYQALGNFSGVDSKGLNLSSGKKKEENCCLVFTSSIKREIRQFHVVVVQRRQRNVQKSVMHVQNCCFPYLKLLLFRRYRSRRRRRA